MNPLPIDYIGFAHSVMGLWLRRQLAQRYGVDERYVFVCAVGVGTFYSMIRVVESWVSDGIPFSVEFVVPTESGVIREAA